jgi:dienelactone hydrolase
MLMRLYLVGILLVTGCAGAPRKVAAVPPPAAEIPGAVLVHFPSNDADLTHGAPTTLDGWLFRPEGPGPFPAVVALHGCAGLYAKGQLSARDRDWSERLVKEGYVVLLPDSFSARGVDEICSRKERTVRPTYERNRDAYGALLYLQGQPFVRGNDVGLIGWSNGGITVLATIAAKTHARPRDLAHDFRVAVAFYPSCRTALDRSSDWIPPVAPVHILMGAADDWTPAPPCQDLGEKAKAAGSPIDVVIYPGAYHDFDHPNMPVHSRDDVATTASGHATLGTDPAARADAIARVSKVFHDTLRPGGS